MSRRAPPGLWAVIADAGRGRLIGVEREYEVVGPDGPVDARSLWPGLPDPGVHLDPGDPLARRERTGGVITADGRHAEQATPPVVLRPGSTIEVLALAAAGREHLAQQLPAHRLVGYSTHVSVQVADRNVVAVARLVARRLALPIMLGLDRTGSPGLLVRPRPGRLEVGGEFAAGDQLRAAVALTVGMVLLAERSLGVRRSLLPHVPDIRPAPAVQRFGWYVDRTAYGPDLYRAGRSTQIGTASAQDILATLWARARGLTQGLLSDNERGLVDHAIDGRRALPLEEPQDDDRMPSTGLRRRDYGPRHRGGIVIEVARATWWKALLRFEGGGTVRWMVIPGRSLDRVLDHIDIGVLDADLARVLAGPVHR